MGGGAGSPLGSRWLIIMEMSPAARPPAEGRWRGSQLGLWDWERQGWVSAGSPYTLRALAGPIGARGHPRRCSCPGCWAELLGEALGSLPQARDRGDGGLGRGAGEEGSEALRFIPETSGLRVLLHVQPKQRKRPWGSRPALGIELGIKTSPFVERVLCQAQGSC